jgi:hypothetical protein
MFGVNLRQRDNAPPSFGQHFSCGSLLSVVVHSITGPERRFAQRMETRVRSIEGNRPGFFKANRGSFFDCTNDSTPRSASRKIYFARSSVPKRLLTIEN